MTLRRFRWVVLAATLWLAAAVAMACGGAPGNGDGDEVAKDFPIDVYQGQSAVGGDATTFNSLLAMERPIVLNFWAALCPPCRAEMPDIQRVHDSFSDRVTFFGLDVGPFQFLGTREDGRALLMDLGVTYPSGSTQSGQVIKDYAISNMPTTFFIRPNGEIQRKWAGLLNEDKLVELVEELIESSQG